MSNNTVTTLDEAKDWFLSHASGSVTATKPSGETRELWTYREAVAFFAQDIEGAQP